ncbi:MAG TPA: hypothetical protein VF786_03995 [Terriglobales bacterium]
MTLPADVHRCIGIGTADGKPESECLACERRTAGIADYVHGSRSVLWMAPPTQRPCPAMLEPKGARHA